MEGVYSKDQSKMFDIVKNQEVSLGYIPADLGN